MRRQLDPEAEANMVAGFRRRRRFHPGVAADPAVVDPGARARAADQPHLRGLAPGGSLRPDYAFLSYPKPQLEERAVEQLRVYRAEIEFDSLLGARSCPVPASCTPSWPEARPGAQAGRRDQESTHAIKNVLADLGGLVGFVLVCVVWRRDLQVLRSFLDELVYGLSDSAKAFAIILFTDIFVGFHSPEGWTVLLDGVANHLGLPAQENFILLFIATFPVILATVFKYWIFRYLNRVSPSSVATLRNMNGGG